MTNKSIDINDSFKNISSVITELLAGEKNHQPKESLSDREIDILKLLVEGFSNKEIADKLFISPHTVISHRKNITQKTSEISEFARKGVHTTTFAEMFFLENNTRLIDTPGIKELGLIDMEPAEVSDYFPEMRAVRNNCKFSNCLHVHEPKCAVIEAVEQAKISIERYESYLSMILGDDNRR